MSAASMQSLREVSGPLLSRLEELMARQKAESQRRRRTHGWPETVECSGCGDTGVLPESPAEPCPLCEQGARIEQAMRHAARWEQEVPRLYAPYTLDSHPHQDVVAKVRAWIGPDRPIVDTNLTDEDGCIRWSEAEIRYKRPERNLILLGDPGRGKSGVAVAALRELYLRGFSVRFDSTPDIIDGLRPDTSVVGKPLRAAGQPVAVLERVDVLLLDDLGTEKQSEFAVERLQMIINGRYERKLPTIITSNRTIAELRDLVGERIISRLMEAAERIHIGGPDLRRSPPPSR